MKSYALTFLSARYEALTSSAMRWSGLSTPLPASTIP